VVKVVLIDDSQTVLKIMSGSLAAAGFLVKTASNGLEGLVLVRYEKPDAVVLDVNLPDFSGLEVLARLKEDAELRTIPVLLLTTQGDAASASRGMELGASGFLAKHATAPKLLVQRLHELLKDRA